MMASTTLSYRPIGRWKYRLEEVHTVQTRILGHCVGNDYAWLYSSGELIVGIGYRWDGASGLTIDTPNTMVASLVHDVFYQFMRQRKLGQELRKPVDKLFRRLLRTNGMGWFRAWYWYRAVRRFAAFAARPGTEPTDEVIAIAVGGTRRGKTKEAR